jgi:hypothetical protein
VGLIVEMPNNVVATPVQRRVGDALECQPAVGVRIIDLPPYSLSAETVWQASDVVGDPAD